MRSSFLVALCLSLLLAGCGRDGLNREQVGRVFGGIAGGVLGSRIGEGAGRTAATIAGSMLGAHLGGIVGRRMNDYDFEQIDDALDNNHDQQPSSWQNPDTGYRYSVTPQYSYYDNNQRICREFRSTALIKGREEDVYGTACRQPDGSWKARE